MKQQNDPSVGRLLRLLAGNPTVVLGWGAVVASELDAAERAGIDGLVELVEEGKRLVAQGDATASTADAAALEQELADLSGRIGAQLRALNATGVFVAAERRVEQWHLEDPATGAPYPHSEAVVRLDVLRSAAAAA